MEYHKIQSVFKRDAESKHKRFLIGQYSCPEFEYLRFADWIGTEKVDGTNIRIYGKSENGLIAGRTNNAQIPPFLMEVLKPIADKLLTLDLPDNTILYGEGYGAKIQNGGSYIPDGQSFVLFDVMMGGNFQPIETVKEIAAMMGLRSVPVLGCMTLDEWTALIPVGFHAESSLHPGAPNEGVVLRPKVELQTRTGQRVITKLKFKDFR